MALKPAEGFALPTTQVLILGPKAEARLISQSLAELGWHSILESECETPVPAPEEFESDTKLKAWLEHWIARSKRVTPSARLTVHPGVSGWADRPELAVITQDLRIALVGAPGKVLSYFANQLSLLSEAEAAGIRHLVMNFEPIHSMRELERFIEAESRRFPFVLKSIRPANRQRICVVHSRDQLKSSFTAWQEQLRTFSNGSIFFAERYLEGGRFITVPFYRDLRGNRRVLGLVDASLQSRNRRLIEIAPAEGLDERAVQAIEEAVKTLADRLNFQGVGSLEFLVEGENAYLIGGLSRLAPSFPLWKSMSGIDPVLLQIQINEGRAVDETTPHEPVHGLCARLFAEDEILQLPRPGTIKAMNRKRRFRLPGGSAELHLSYDLGESIDLKRDGQVGFLKIEARDRKQLFSIAENALGEIWIAGSLLVNNAFLQAIVGHSWVKEGHFHAGFIDEDLLCDTEPGDHLRRVFASLCMRTDEAPEEKGAWVVGERLALPLPGKLRFDEGPRDFLERGMRGYAGVLSLDEGVRVPFFVYPVAQDRWLVRVGKWARIVRRTREKRKGQLKIHSLVSGRVHSIRFQAGAMISAHEPVILIDSLQTLVPHSLPIPLRVKRWNVRAEEWVTLGQELAELE